MNSAEESSRIAKEALPKLARAAEDEALAAQARAVEFQEHRKIRQRESIKMAEHYARHCVERTVSPEISSTAHSGETKVVVDISHDQGFIGALYGEEYAVHFTKCVKELLEKEHYKVCVKKTFVDKLGEVGYYKTLQVHIIVSWGHAHSASSGQSLAIIWKLLLVAGVAIVAVGVLVYV